MTITGGTGRLSGVAAGLRATGGAGVLAAVLLLVAGASTPPSAPAQQPDHHELFTELLQEVVVDSLVDYRALMEREDLLRRYTVSLADPDRQELRRIPEEDQLAFWINAYNACMLEVVADHYPIEAGGTGLLQAARNLFTGRPENSVWQIPDVFDGAHCQVAGAARSLDEIEHEIIRPEFGDPRIHFAVNCAAYSCPVLREEAYVGGRLDRQLEEQVERFIADGRHFRLEPGDPPTLTVNRVLDWYDEDFGGTAGIPHFFASYVEGRDRSLLQREDVRVEFFEYDWTLNDIHAEPGS